MPHIPLQAADMLAYRLRQAASNLEAGTYDLSKLDKLLLKGLLRSAANANPELRRFKDRSVFALPAAGISIAAPVLILAQGRTNEAMPCVVSSNNLILSSFTSEDKRLFFSLFLRFVGQPTRFVAQYIVMNEFFVHQLFSALINGSPARRLRSLKPIKTVLSPLKP
jgi:hypothetical protein